MSAELVDSISKDLYLSIIFNRLLHVGLTHGFKLFHNNLKLFNKSNIKNINKSLLKMIERYKSLEIESTNSALMVVLKII
jgi:hypothetical protein